MKVFIDGKEVKVTTDLVVLYEDIAGSGGQEDLQIKLTDDGAVFDILDKEGEVVATSWQYPDDMADDCLPV